MKARIASFLVPVLTAVVLLYQVLALLQIAVTHQATLLVIGVTLTIAAVAGLVAAIGPQVVRVGVLAACALVFLDVTSRLSNVFEHLRPGSVCRETIDASRTFVRSSPRWTITWHALRAVSAASGQPVAHSS